MKCPFCEYVEDKVVDSRLTKEDQVIRRRRECLRCGKRFTTYERIEEIPPMVVKKDGSRQPFERQKILTGLLKACEKRPVAVADLEAIIEEIENLLNDRKDREIQTREVGEVIMRRLSELDQVAYVRFASVYRQFKDINEFINELEGLLGKRR
jgi:transcriptional repressor NrdR